MRFYKTVASVVLLSCVLMPSFAFAHSGHETSGLLAGMLHPLLGWDHLLAMLAVGMLTVLAHQRVAWQLPVAFVGFMLIGGMLGVNGIAITGVETGIMLSLIVLGGLLAMRQRAYLTIVAVLCAAFGLLHGMAHGIELAVGQSAISYSIGFVLATIALHGAGWLIASKWQTIVIRVSGLAIASIGAVAMLGTMFNVI